MGSQTKGRRQQGSKTKLALGKLSKGVTLYKTTGAAQEEREYDTAGPNGGRLRYVQRAQPKSDTPADTPAEAPAAIREEASDPLALDSLGPLPPSVRDDIETEAAQAEGAQTKAAAPEAEMRQVLVEEAEGKSEAEWPEVEREDVRRGIRKDDGSFVDLTDQLAAIDENSKLDEMRVEAFIDIGQVRRTRVLGSYYVALDDPSAAPFLRALYLKMREARRAAVVKWTKRTGQSLGVLVADGRTDCLVCIEYEFSNRVREPHAKALAVRGARPSDRLMAGVGTLIEALSDTTVALDEMVDDRTQLTSELLQAVEEGKVAAFKVPDKPAAEDDDIEALLEASVA
jgi:non-homologous end joining protein Ku